MNEKIKTIVHGMLHLIAALHNESHIIVAVSRLSKLEIKKMFATHDNDEHNSSVAS